MPSEFHDNFLGELEVLDIDEVAGREALVLDWYTVDDALLSEVGGQSEPRIYKGRYWVDTYYGVIQRRQRSSTI